MNKILLLFLSLFLGCQSKSPFASNTSNWGVEKGQIGSKNLIYVDEYVKHYPDVWFNENTMIINVHKSISNKNYFFNYSIEEKVSNKEYIVKLSNKNNAKSIITHFYFDNLQNGLDKNGCQEMYIVGEGIELYLWKCLNGVIYLDINDKKDIIINKLP